MSASRESSANVDTVTLNFPFIYCRGLYHDSSEDKGAAMISHRACKSSQWKPVRQYQQFATYWHAVAQWVWVKHVLQFHLDKCMWLESSRQSFPSYQADQRREEHPTELPPATRPVADHVLNVLIKPFSSCGEEERGRQRRSAWVWKQ